MPTAPGIDSIHFKARSAKIARRVWIKCLKHNETANLNGYSGIDDMYDSDVALIRSSFLKTKSIGVLSTWP
ncbi:hypothetical protein VTN49DRAFT_7383 [Thermomyces lanuginosus]|uniref:uncharacterized protein n=1 Tax=Thermomyces lanuginosus TaxID=5541 RepID=UPI0037437F10